MKGIIKIPPRHAKDNMFHGSYTALITPFRKGKIDESAFEALIERQIVAGTHGLVPAGTTGESPTLSHEEHNRVIELTVKVAKGRAKVMAGTGSNATSEAIMMTQHAEKMGADGALIIVPYYNKPTQEGLYQHYKAIHDATRIPIILYNVPGRTVVDMSNDTIARLAELPRIAGLKDATGKLERVTDLAKKLPKGKAFDQISGEDDNVVDYYKLGGVGCISVTSNIAPEWCASMHNHLLKKEFEAAQKIQDKLMVLHKAMFVETSPGPVKYAAHLMGLCASDIRLPLVQPEQENGLKIREVLEEVGLL